MNSLAGEIIEEVKWIVPSGPSKLRGLSLLPFT
jgi:hypothetical protein